MISDFAGHLNMSIMLFLPYCLFLSNHLLYNFFGKLLWKFWIVNSNHKFSLMGFHTNNYEEYVFKGKYNFKLNFGLWIKSTCGIIVFRKDKYKICKAQHKILLFQTIEFILTRWQTKNDRLTCFCSKSSSHSKAKVDLICH